MKQHILPAIRLSLVCLIFFCVIYPFGIWAIAQATPDRGEGSRLLSKGRVVGYQLEGQKFTNDIYFNGRPSAVGYNAAGSGGSNKGPTNPDYLIDLQTRIDSFLVHNPSINKEQIPSELITASGSGLDPDISLQAALIQIPRIANRRGISTDALKSLVSEHLRAPLLGFIGTERINVLELNLDLDRKSFK